MRLILLCLAGLVVLIQYPLWLGKGGWLRVWDLEKQVNLAQKKNDDLRTRNAKLDSEVMDLKQGTGAVEERARYELGMIRNDEIFVQIVDPNSKPVTDAGTAASQSAPLNASPAASTNGSSIALPETKTKSLSSRSGSRP